MTPRCPTVRTRAARAGARRNATADDLDRRALPPDGPVGVAVGQVRRAEELQLLVLLRLAGRARAGDADRHGHLPDDELQARRGQGVRVGRVHHARRRVGLAHPLHALHRRVDVLRRRLPAHVPRAAVRQLSQAARAAVDLRLPRLPRADGRGVLRLPASLGPDELLGRAGDRQPVLDDSRHRRRPRGVDPRRLHRLRHHAQPLLRVPRDRGAAGAARAGGRAPHGAARGGLEQPRRRRHQAPAPRSADRPSARRHLLASVLHDQGHRRRRRLPGRVLDHPVLRAGHGRLLPRGEQLHPGRSAEDARAHRAGVVLHAVLRDAARRAVVLRHAGLGRAGDGRRRAGLLLPALARPRRREVDPLPRHAVQGRGSRRSWCRS